MPPMMSSGCQLPSSKSLSSADVLCSSSPAISISRKIGVSSMRERRYMPTRPIGPATKNGMRQPQSYIVASPRPRENPNISSAPKEKPAKVPNSRKLPQKPRFASGEYSAMNVDAPPYSPPVENPWIRRSTMRNAGAQNPTLSKEGIRPTASVAPDISNIVSASTAFRPNRSPSGPQNNPPTGRQRKDIANDARPNRVAWPVVRGNRGAAK